MLYLFAAKIRVHDLSKNKIEQSPPVIYASNHKCFADFCLISTFLTKPFTILIKKEMINNIFFRFLAWKMALIPIDRQNIFDQKKAMEKAKKLIIKNNYSLIIFPEGWHIVDKRFGDFKKGITILAKETDVNVIPIALYGVNNNFIHENKLNWKHAYIKAGEPVNYKNFGDDNSFLDEVEKKISSLYNELEIELSNVKSRFN